MAFDGTRGIPFLFMFRKVPPTGPLGSPIFFKAYIKNIDADINPQWDEKQDVGRADAKILYTSIKKTLKVDFDVVAEDPESTSVNSIRDKLNELADITLPTYNGRVGFHGNYVQFTIGKLYVNQFGYIMNMNFSWDNREITWEIRDQLPYLNRVSMTIGWIGRRKPQTGVNFFG